MKLGFFLSVFVFLALIGISVHPLIIVQETMQSVSFEQCLFENESENKNEEVKGLKKFLGSEDFFSVGSFSSGSKNLLADVGNSSCFQKVFTPPPEKFRLL